MSYALLFLAIHPNVQEKAVNELIEVFGTEKVEINYDRLQKCDYLEMIIKETLRLCPSVPGKIYSHFYLNITVEPNYQTFPISVIARETLAEIELEPGLVIPPGVDIIVNLFALHRRFADWGLDSKMFNPDRFLPDAVAKRHPYSYMPFSIGVRNCIGMSLFTLKYLIFSQLHHVCIFSSLFNNSYK